ncbi:MAG: LuxR C-terminal-related transcriptional regulator, partial [Thermoleophilia bacterium]|nr:LuxR C-terminal-related transcriptional regulator [Thermoleophilia bacterium]
TGTLEGSIEALRAAYVELVGGNAEAAVRRAARANRLLSAEDNRNLSFALVVQTVALQASGHLQAALDLAQSTIEDERFRSQRWNWAPSAWSLPYVGWLETDLRLQCQYASALWRQGQDRQLPDTIAHGCYFLGIAAYERNELLDAEEHLSTLVDAKYEVRPIVYLNGAFALALCHQARGEPAEATRVIDAAMGFALDGVGDFLMPAVEAFQSELSMRQGRWAEAAQWAERVDPYPPRWQYMFYEPVVTLAKALLAQGSEAADDRAAELLERYEAFAESLHIRPLLIQLLGLRAIACEAQGDDQRALQALGRAISLSLPGGAVRFLADLGPALVGPLNRLDAAGEELAHVGSILAAIAPHGGEGRSREGGAVGRLGVPVSGSETLTERELEVLTLLDRRLSNKEIARELMIAPSTVKKHTISLYQKLHVSGRREAAEKARALGYLDDD